MTVPVHAGNHEMSLPLLSRRSGMWSVAGFRRSIRPFTSRCNWSQSNRGAAHHQMTRTESIEITKYLNSYSEIL